MGQQIHQYYHDPLNAKSSLALGFCCTDVTVRFTVSVLLHKAIPGPLVAFDLSSYPASTMPLEMVSSPLKAKPTTARLHPAPPSPTQPRFSLASMAKATMDLNLLAGNF